MPEQGQLMETVVARLGKLLPCGLAAAVFAASTAGAAVVTTTVVGDEVLTETRAVLLLQVQGSDVEPTRLPIEIGSTQTIPAPPGAEAPATLEASVEMEGYWSEKVRLRPEPTPTEIRIVKTREVGFTVDAEAHVDLPTEVHVAFESPPSYGPDDPTAGLAGSAACGIRERKAWCRLPSLTLDVRFSAENYAPFYLWDLDVAGSKPEGLPALEFKPGGTIIGRAVDERGDAVLDANVYLMPPLTGRSYDSALAARLRRLAMESKTNDRGYFQLVGIPDGSYRILLEKPGLATTEATPEPILVEKSEHVLTHDVTVPPAVEVTVELTPEFDPSSNPWRVWLHPRSSIKHLVTESATLDYADGGYSTGGLVPGTYDLMVKGSDDVRWWIEPVEVLPGSQRFDVTMDLFLVTGTVFAGDSPVPGRLVLNEGGAEMEFEVDESGNFSGVLPKSGCWRIKVLPGEQDGAEIARPCEQIEPVEGLATLSIELPDTRLAGEVVDGLDRPVENATVKVYSRSAGRTFSTARSDADGEFSLTGLPPGPVALLAEEGGREATQRTLVLSEEEETPWQTLILLEDGEVSGQVSTAGGSPLAGAQVVLWPEIGATPGARVEVTSTDMSGVFRTSVPEEARWLNLIVGAPGFGTRILRTSRQLDQPLLIELEPGGGQLLLDLAVVEGGASKEATMPSAGRAIVSYEGVEVPLPLLRVVAAEGAPISVTGRMRLDSMEQGTYSLCTRDTPPHSSGEPEQPAAPRCTSAYLPRGGQVTLSTGGLDADSR